MGRRVGRVARDGSSWPVALVTLAIAFRNGIGLYHQPSRNELNPPFHLGCGLPPTGKPAGVKGFAKPRAGRPRRRGICSKPRTAASTFHATSTRRRLTTWSRPEPKTVKQAVQPWRRAGPTFSDIIGNSPLDPNEKQTTWQQ